ncbi:protein of unknown function [Cupriavidus neocaledonicus]|uniref:Uncharacterized protein n=1 Tax=Cupriavidus neocaledonicus TaxID=1040979 RepID=A0A375HD19_9BURK|nr:hypothetical protein CBM2605_A270004 [Cupriavidus neocaledonicus]SPD48157.1 protein of unknown function [Cupriavidus neocaledonicus]
MCRIPSHLSITLKYIWLIQSQPGIAFGTTASHQRSRDTFTTSHIVKEQPIIQIAWQCQMQALNAKRLHLANQTKVPGDGGG